MADAGFDSDFVAELRDAGLLPYCGEWVGTERCNARAEFILWGKLIPAEGLGPRCYDCAAKHIGHRGLTRPGASGWAVADLRPLLREAGVPVGGNSSLPSRDLSEMDRLIRQFIPQKRYGGGEPVADPEFFEAEEAWDALNALTKRDTACPGYPECTCSVWAAADDPHGVFGAPGMMGG